MRLAAFRLSFVIGAVAWLLAACSGAAELERRTIEHDDIEREYFVHVPANAPARPQSLPLVVALHGYAGTAASFEAYYQLNTHADAHGYLVVYPQGTDFSVAGEQGRSRTITSWNDLAANLPSPPERPHCTSNSVRYPCPPECGDCTACMWTSCYDDVGFLDAMLTEVIDDYPVDVQRVYLLGVSNGGMMALRLGCNLASRFAAIAPIIGQLAPGYACGPNVDVPLLHLAGGEDETVRPDGMAGAADGFIYTSVAETTSVWADALTCEAGPHAWRTSQSDTAGLECTAYSQCRIAGHEVVSCIDPGGGHEWPGQKDAASVGMDLVWAFFSSHSRTSVN